MKVRIGFGLGTHTSANESGPFGSLVDALEGLRFDSLWLSERLTGDAPDPLAALAFAAGRTRRLKLGTSVLVLPGRNPVVLAKEMASLDRLSGGRFLPAVGLGALAPAEHRAFGVRREERSAWFDEALGLLRRLWTEDHVTHDGPRFAVDDVTLRPQPIQQPIDVWLGGQAPSELRRVGRLGDGWLPSFCTVDDVAAGWPMIEATAAQHGRTIDPEHLGALIAYSRTGVPDRVRALLARRRPELDPRLVVPVGLDELRSRVEGFVAVGASKFVVLPLDEPTSWDDELRSLAEALFDLQT
ncbi:MAG: TIGR03619 family F420-dependent LLM class oxidoreductase [Acidimicrobiales bacterium]|nr:TIGR03619 family F420-dependent LLM class oxidoreductase [Acidimicrobiales bacterium]HRW38781.1 TIGR03619 family F420-dependent LLM class oxidoreductase [Aquihabitans sp.]